MYPNNKNYKPKTYSADTKYLPSFFYFRAYHKQIIYKINGEENNINMEGYKLLPIPAEDYDALGITPDSVLETSITDSNALIVRVVKDEDMVDLVCGSDCECCPLNGGKQ
jgi:hypothetical protein